MNTRRFIFHHGRRIEVIETPAPATQRRPSVRVKFVQVPAFWIDKLVQQNGRVYDVALLLLQLDFKNRGRPVTLSNEATRHLKLDRRVKYRTLVRLEMLDLISVAHKRGSAPLVIVKHLSL
jgi:hypothetical protein